MNLRVLFWLDITKFSQFKVKSAIIRLVKTAFEENKISMPDDQREVIFPDGVPVRMLTQADDARAGTTDADKKSKKKDAIESQESVEAEGDLQSDAIEIKAQARKSRNPEIGTDLLHGPT